MVCNRMRDDSSSQSLPLHCYVQAFRKIYSAPLIARFNSEVMTAGGGLQNGTSFNFTVDDIYAMQLLCGYETAIRGSSPFCSTQLFDADAWLSFDYAQDVMYFYNSIGYASSIAGSMGTPWINASAELLLAGNATQDLYVSFSHRE